MAVYAAHLTRTLQGTPSLFQVIAQEALGSTVKPAVRKIFEYISAVYGGRLDEVLQWYDEVFLVLDACLQHHYLKHYAASFSECFYSLQRVSVSPSPEFGMGPGLDQRARLGSLLELCALPYLRDKLLAVLHREIHKQHDKWSGLRVFLVSVLSCWEGARAAVLARYCVGGGAHSPALGALGLRLGPAPARGGDTHWGDWLRALRGGHIRSVSFPMLGGALLRVMEYGAFLVQFLRWWESARPHSAVGTLQRPVTLERAPLSVRFQNVCPVCVREWRTPAALPVSGYIFCYSCIRRELSVSGRCPVTWLPAAAASLRRVYLH